MPEPAEPTESVAPTEPASGVANSTGPASEAVPGAALLRAVAVMDRLRSPGGCPWDAEQTHSSLAPYLLEEAYETLEAIEDEDLTALREELGDLLLQILFHARLAEEAPEPFTIDQVADDLVAKLVRRHPHVFADVSVDSAAQVNSNWDAIKKAEKQRQSATDGIPLGQPALALAAKLISRSQKAGIVAAVDLPDEIEGADAAARAIGDKLFAIVAEAVQAGVDPELALRASARRYRSTIRSAEGHRD
ncbi:MazG family protein [Jatrophihabitans sp. DSM 45814]